jgi:DNA-binding transcriptional MerR regulator
MDFLTTQDITQLFSISHQTVKNWSVEFAEYLSPMANPSQGRKRLFTPDDVKAFALVHDYRERGYTYEDIHLALKTGQRGEIPEQAGQIVPTIPPALLTSLRLEMNNLQEKLQTTQTERDEYKGQVKLLREQLTEEREISREVIEENARLKAQQGK